MRESGEKTQLTDVLSAQNNKCDTRNSLRKISLAPVKTSNDNRGKNSHQIRRFSDSAAFSPVIANYNILPPVHKLPRGRISTDSFLHRKIDDNTALLERREFGLAKKNDTKSGMVDSFQEASEVNKARKGSGCMASPVDGLNQLRQAAKCLMPEACSSGSNRRSRNVSSCSINSSSNARNHSVGEYPSKQKDFREESLLRRCKTSVFSLTSPEKLINESKVDDCLEELFPNFYSQSVSKLQRTLRQPEISMHSSTVVPQSKSMKEKSVDLGKCTSSLEGGENVQIAKRKTSTRKISPPVRDDANTIQNKFRECDSGGRKKAVVPYDSSKKAVVPYDSSKKAVVPYDGSKKAVVPYDSSKKAVVPYDISQKAVVPYNGSSEKDIRSYINELKQKNTCRTMEEPRNFGQGHERSNTRDKQGSSQPKQKNTVPDFKKRDDLFGGVIPEDLKNLKTSELGNAKAAGNIWSYGFHSPWMNVAGDV
eukprot:gene12763-14073_t